MSRTKDRKEAALRAQVRELVDHFDCIQVNLGAIKMPDGYALLWSHSNEMYFWVRWDGAESPIYGNRWNCYHAAKSYKRTEVLR